MKIDIRDAETDVINIIEVVFGDRDVIIIDKDNPETIIFKDNNTRRQYEVYSCDIDNLIKALQYVKQYV